MSQTKLSSLLVLFVLLNIWVMTQFLNSSDTKDSYSPILQKNEVYCKKGEENKNNKIQIKINAQGSHAIFQIFTKDKNLKKELRIVTKNNEVLIQSPFTPEHEEINLYKLQSMTLNQNFEITSFSLKGLHFSQRLCHNG